MVSLVVCRLQWRTGVNIVRQEGAHVLWSGWQASLARSFFYGGVDNVTRLSAV